MSPAEWSNLCVWIYYIMSVTVARSWSRSWCIYLCNISWRKMNVYPWRCGDRARDHWHIIWPLRGLVLCGFRDNSAVCQQSWVAVGARMPWTYVDKVSCTSCQLGESVQMKLCILCLVKTIGMAADICNHRASARRRHVLPHACMCKSSWHLPSHAWYRGMSSTCRRQNATENIDVLENALETSQS